MRYCMAISAGVLAVAFLPKLLPSGLIVFLWVVFLVVGVFYLKTRFGQSHPQLLHLVLLLMLFLAGLSWANYWGHLQLSERLAPELEGVDITVTGKVASLPDVEFKDYGVERVRFNFRVLSAHLSNGKAINQPQLIRLSWYPGAYQASASGLEAELKAGEFWQFKVRLKRPHGYSNPGGFDYERWLLASGLGATGYVREDKVNRRLASARWSANSLRQTLRDFVLANNERYQVTPLLLALLVGDQSHISSGDRHLIQAMGLSHLLAISGLHVGLAGALGFALGSGLGRLLSLLGPTRIFAPQVAVVCACLCAFFYAMLAGFSISTQRALIMLLVWSCFYTWGRRHSPWLPWWVAFALANLVQPLAVFEAGFWLSFTAVAILLMVIRRPLTSLSWIERLRALLKIQLLLLLGLSAVQLSFGFPLSLIAPIINIIAIPYTGFLLIPVLLLVAVSLPLSSAVAIYLLKIASLIAGVFWLGLLWFQALLERFDLVLLLEPMLAKHPALLALALLMAVVVLSPAARAVRFIALLALLCGFFPLPRDQSGLMVRVLDVGQGLSVLISHENHHLLYDTGAGYRSGSSVGSSVILPVLSSLAVDELELLVVSHADNDHSGGVKDLSVSGLKIAKGLSSDLSWRSKTFTDDESQPNFSLCHSDERWLMGELEVQSFAVDRNRWQQSNNQSCVLLLSYQGQKILLPGDVESKRERALLAHPWLKGNSIDVLVAAHHGSKTSSSKRFIEQLNPTLAIVSAGHRNRYGHPHTSVVERLSNSGAQIYNTAAAGAVSIHVSEQGRLTAYSYRRQVRRYWR